MGAHGLPRTSILTARIASRRNRCRHRFPNALTLAGRAASLAQIEVKQTKKGDLSNKWRIDARLQGERLLTFDVEISRRGVPGDDYVTHKTVEGPRDYRITPFRV